MKAKFLKRVRKRFKWFWDVETNQWFLLDFKERERLVYSYSSLMFRDIINKLLRLGAAISFLKKRSKAIDRNKFREVLKKYESKK